MNELFGKSFPVFNFDQEPSYIRSPSSTSSRFMESIVCHLPCEPKKHSRRSGMQSSMKTAHGPS